MLQVEAFKLFLERNPTSTMQLCMIGSVRDKAEDRAIVEQLQRLIGQYHLEVSTVLPNWECIH